MHYSHSYLKLLCSKPLHFLFLWLVNVGVSAYDLDVNGIFYNITGENTVEVTYVEFDNGNSDFYYGNIQIPRRISTQGSIYNVTGIGNGAFFYCYDLRSVSIPESIEYIGDDAFYGCRNLKSIVIPKSVTQISDACFYECNSLTSIVIPEGVTSIGSGAFRGCSSLTSINIPSTLTSIRGEYTFQDCNNLTAVHITDLAAWCKIKYEYYYSLPLAQAHHLFMNGEEITDLVIPEEVTIIEKGAFEGCDGLTSVTIPSSVTSIGNSAFESCSGITFISIPNSVTSIGERAFAWVFRGL